MELTNNQRKLLGKLANTHTRKKSGFFICEGKRSCEEALKNAVNYIEFAVVSSTEKKILDFSDFSFPVYEVNEKDFAEFADTSTPQGVMLVMRESDFLEKEDIPNFILVLDRITDPGNFGTIIRTAWAAGIVEVWITNGTCDVFCTKAVRSAMGAHFYLNFRKFNDLADVEKIVQKNGAKLVLTKPLAKINCFSPEVIYGEKNAFVVGNEANGIIYTSESAQEITIPMPGNAESLNVATAATIIIFEYVRRNLFNQ